MLTKPAILECTRCGKIFIGWQSDARPKRPPVCLKCQAREAWQLLSGAVEPRKGRAAGGGRGRPARKAAKPGGARRKPAKRGAARPAAGRRPRRRT